MVEVHSADYGPLVLRQGRRAARRATSGASTFSRRGERWYVGDYLGRHAEAVRARGATAQDSQAAHTLVACRQCHSARSMGRASPTSRPGQCGTSGRLPKWPRSLARTRGRARAARVEGFAGIPVLLREDPKRRLGLALFSQAGRRLSPSTSRSRNRFLLGSGTSSASSSTASTAGTRCPAEHRRRIQWAPGSCTNASRQRPQHQPSPCWKLSHVGQSGASVSDPGDWSAFLVVRRCQLTADAHVTARRSSAMT